jgi:hypothetical protein
MKRTPSQKQERKKRETQTPRGKVFAKLVDCPEELNLWEVLCLSKANFMFN